LQLEVSGPRSIIGAAEANNARALLERARANPPAIVASARTSADASDWVSRGEMLLRAGSTAAMDDFALALGLGDGQALDGLHRAALAARRVDEALAILEGLPRTRQTDPSVDVTISRLLAGSGDLPRAAEAAARALRHDGAHVGALTQLASVQADAGDAEGLAQTVGRLRTLAPAAADTQYYDGVLAYQRGDFRAAAARADETLAAQPGHARALTLSGAAYASLGHLDRARKTFEAAVAATPDDPAPYVNLGQLELSVWNARRASDWFTEALAVDPTSTAARDGLATALERRGEHARATRIRGASR
jgi:tetratricopeptide (TPR) repeat protein